MLRIKALSLLQNLTRLARNSTCSFSDTQILYQYNRVYRDFFFSNIPYINKYSLIIKSWITVCQGKIKMSCCISTGLSLFFSFPWCCYQNFSRSIFASSAVATTRCCSGLNRGPSKADCAALFMRRSSYRAPEQHRRISETRYLKFSERDSLRAEQERYHLNLLVGVTLTFDQYIICIASSN
jgi:hypothetical protein